MAVVKINSVQSVEVDGVDVGSLAAADKVLTFEEIQAAVVEWHDRERAALQAVFAGELRRTADEFNTKGLELQKQYQERIGQYVASGIVASQEIERLNVECQRLMTEGNAIIAAQGQEIDRLKKVVQTLTAHTPDAAAIAVEIKRHQLKAVADEAQRQLAELG